MTKAFSFIEVIISAVILSFMGVAILNFNSFNKKSMEQYIAKQSTLLISSPFILIQKDIDTNKEYKLIDLVKFQNLSDEDKKFLKDTTISGKKEFKEKIFLYTDGKKEHYVDFGNFELNYGDNKKISYIYLEKSKSK